MQSDLKWIHEQIDKVKDPFLVKKLKHLLLSLNTSHNTSHDIENALKNIEDEYYFSEEKARELQLKNSSGKF